MGNYWTSLRSYFLGHHRGVIRTFQVTDNDQEQLQEATLVAERFLNSVRQGVQNRKRTISTLKHLANELDATKENTLVVKFGAASIGVLGGAVAIGGTLGAATPLVIGGLSAAVGGWLTARGSDIAEYFISKKALKKTQKILEADKTSTENIDSNYRHLYYHAQRLSVANPGLGTIEVVISNLLIGSGLSNHHSEYVFRSQRSSSLYMLGAMGTFAVINDSGKLGSEMAALFAKGALKGTESVARTVLGTVFMTAAIIFDIYELFKVLNEIHNGSKSAIAGSLRELSTELETHLPEMEAPLQELEQQVEELRENLKKTFRELIKEISRCDEQDVTQEQLERMWAYIRASQPYDDWMEAFQHVPNQGVHLHQMCRVYMLLEEHIKKHSRESVIDVTLIAHGGIRSPMLSGFLHYVNPYLQKITLYEPWGCSIDASVVYGITTGLINTHNVRYTDRVIPSRPTCWNDLPRNTTIPEVYFSYVKTNEGAYSQLMELVNVFRAETRGVVIPFFQSPLEIRVLEHPLWAISNAIALVGYRLDVQIKLHIAACLATEDRSLLRYHSNDTYFVNFNQYCSVPVRLPSASYSPIMMTCLLQGNHRPRHNMDVLSRWLIQ